MLVSGFELTQRVNDAFVDFIAPRCEDPGRRERRVGNFISILRNAKSKIYRFNVYDSLTKWDRARWAWTSGIIAERFARIDKMIATRQRTAKDLSTEHNHVICLVGSSLRQIKLIQIASQVGSRCNYHKMSSANWACDLTQREETESQQILDRSHKPAKPENNSVNQFSHFNQLHLHSPPCIDRRAWLNVNLRQNKP